MNYENYGMNKPENKVKDAWLYIFAALCIPALGLLMIGSALLKIK